MTADTHAARHAAAETAATAYLREHNPRTPAEQAALDAVRDRQWMPLHADDYATGVVLLLSRAGLLRDKADEQRTADAERSMSAITDRTRTANRRALGQLTTLAEEGATRLDAGQNPADVAQWLRTTCAAIHNARERAEAGRETREAA